MGDHPEKKEVKAQYRRFRKERRRQSIVRQNPDPGPTWGGAE
jgi:hypothetical protein